MKVAGASREGSLLLMSVLIMAGIITAASTMGLITIHNLQQGILIDHGILSYYAAESGAEDALYEIRKNDAAAGGLPASGTMGNSASWSRSITATAQSVTSDISKDDFWHIDLYDPDASLSPLTNPIKSARLAWTGSGSEWIEVQITPWGTDGNLGTPTTQLFSAASNPAIVNLQDSTSVLYRLRIKSLYADVTDMTVTAWSALNAGGAQVNIPARITILSIGSFRRAKQAVRASMPQREPLSGVFGYVVFSEDDLIKE